MRRFVKSAVSRAARFAAREFADQLQKEQLKTREPAVNVNLLHLLQQLNTVESKRELNQFFAWNHRWIAVLSERNRRAAISTYDFVQSEMGNALFRLNQFEVVRSHLDQFAEGSILDLGVWKGSSTRQLARLFPSRTIHGFDSFEGLPEDWSHSMKGGFGGLAELPDMPDNVRLYKGWFDETLPEWIKENSQPISLLRVDCDIYSSTRSIFQVLGSLVVPGTWVLFDELIGYYGWRDHEYKAWCEFLEQTGMNCEYVAYGLTYVLARILPVGSLSQSTEG